MVALGPTAEYLGNGIKSLAQLGAANGADLFMWALGLGTERFFEGSDRLGCGSTIGITVGRRTWTSLALGTRPLGFMTVPNSRPGRPVARGSR